MDRVFRIVVIALALIGQPVAHGHVESSSTQETHSQRSHVHLGVAHSHTHSHRGLKTSRPAGCDDRESDSKPSDGVSELPEHDRDAIFLPSYQTTKVAEKIFVPCWSLCLGACIDAPSLVEKDVRINPLVFGPPNSWDGMPVFLRTTSLRI